MSYDDYVFFVSEETKLKSIIEKIPAGHVINKLSFERRLEEIQKKLALSGPFSKVKPVRPRITFAGEPVYGTRGALAGFIANALKIFINAAQTITASLTEKALQDSGPIPGAGNNPILVVGPAAGSFGFELEIASQDNIANGADSNQTAIFFDEASAAEQGLRIIVDLLKESESGSEESVAEIIDRLSHRAIQSVTAFLSFMVKNNAFFGLTVDRSTNFHYRNIDEITRSKNMFSNNLKEKEVTFSGMFIGLLPEAGRFEFRVKNGGEIIGGKIIRGVREDIETFIKESLFKTVSVNVKEYRVGKSKPRYRLENFNKSVILN